MTSSLDMIRGRSNIVTLTNNSGGGLVAGDVCVQDTSADEKATTTTSAASTLKIFVAAETIASGAAGRFYESGYCPLVNVNASVTRGRFLFTHTVAKQAAENATYGAGAFGKILKSGTTPSAIIYSATAQISGSGVTRSGSTTDNHLAVWNGSNADSIKDGGVAGAGALVLLEQHAASASATLDFSAFISATYDEYQFEFINIIPTTTGDSLLMRMGTGGGPTYDTGANYTHASLVWNAGGSGVNGSNSATAIILNYNAAGDGIKVVTNWSYNGRLTLFNPGGSTFKFITSHVIYIDSSGSNRSTVNSMGSYESTTAVTAVQFLMSTGTIASGTIRVYGIAKT